MTEHLVEELEKIAATESQYPSWYTPGLTLSLERMDRYAPKVQEVEAVRPQSYRPSEDPEVSCGTCQFFTFALGRAWKGEGRCVSFRLDVEENGVCDDHKAIFGTLAPRTKIAHRHRRPEPEEPDEKEIYATDDDEGGGGGEEQPDPRGGTPDRFPDPRLNQ